MQDDGGWADGIVSSGYASWRRLWRFGMVGATVFAVDFSVLWTLARVLPRLVAVSIAYMAGVTLHFCLNKWWVFESGRHPVQPQLIRYGLTVAACWGCTVAVVWAALHTVTENVFIAKAIAIPPATLLAYVAMRRFVFR